MHEDRAILGKRGTQVRRVYLYIPISPVNDHVERPRSLPKSYLVCNILVVMRREKRGHDWGRNLVVIAAESHFGDVDKLLRQ
jgi:hypothetical protein